MRDSEGWKRRLGRAAVQWLGLSLWRESGYRRTKPRRDQENLHSKEGMLRLTYEEAVRKFILVHATNIYGESLMLHLTYYKCVENKSEWDGKLGSGQ